MPARIPEALLANTPEAMACLDGEGRIVHWNGAARALFGRAPEEALGQPLDRLLGLPQGSARAEALRSLLAGGEGRAGGRVECEARRGDGATLALELSLGVCEVDGRRQALVLFRDLSGHRELEQAMRDTRGKLRDLAANPLVGVYLIQDGLFRYVNATMARIFGYGVEEITDRLGPRDLTRPEDWPRVEENLRRRLEGREKGVHYSFHGITRQGRSIEIEVYGSATRHRGRPAVIGILLDITARRRAERAIRESEARFKGIVEHSPDGILLVDREGRVVFANPAAEALHVRPAAELVGRPFAHPLAPGRTTEIRLERPDGRVALVEMRAVEIGRGEDGECIVLLRDVTRQRSLERELEHQALHDTLTGLANRHLARDRLRQALLQGRREGRGGLVLFLDVDHFKRVNDSYGHLVGDRLLRAVGDRLVRTVRGSDTVARFGGDEFLIIAPGMEHVQDATALAGKLLEAFEEPLELGERQLYSAVSIGIARYPQDGEDADELIRNADAALYRAKETGRHGYHFFTPELNERMARFLAHDAGLRKALERGEISLLYQPVVAAGGALRAAEALLRWNPGGKGEVAPEEFIPVAEENGTIIPIGYWVVDQALGALRRWREAGVGLDHVMVNLSPRQLREPDLEGRLGELLARHGLAPACLELELTEGILIEEPERARRQLDRLHRAGLRLSLDDFGTGYSSLAYLRRFPFDTLKIDRSFLTGIRDDAGNRRLVASIIELGRALGLDTIAEGVEEADSAAFLIEAGCALLQGYHFCRPLPEDGLVAWAARGSAG